MVQQIYSTLHHSFRQEEYHDLLEQVVPILVLLWTIIAAQPTISQQGSSGSDDTAIRAVGAPLPEYLQEGATVLSHDAPRVLRQGDGLFICLADEPDDVRFRAVCYHHLLEPFMARERELRGDSPALKPAGQSGKEATPHTRG